MRHRIVVAPGDGIGPEVVAAAVAVLDAASARFGLELDYHEVRVGGAAIDADGVPLTDATVAVARESDAILFGAVGDPRFDALEGDARPEQAILGLRRRLDLFANLRPVLARPELLDASPLRASRVAGTDLVVVRELTGGLYFGTPKRRWTEDGLRHAVDTLSYDAERIARVARAAFDLARTRRKRVVSVDKANILETSRLWREVVEQVAGDYPDVTLDHMLVDAAAMHLLRSPTRFDVIVTENMFGDILTDEAAVLAGSLGLAPSASIGVRRADGTALGLYEPIHGSAPDIAGSGTANPLGAISSVAMLLQLSLARHDAAECIERAIGAALEDGLRTPDIATDATTTVATSELAGAIAKRVATV